MLGSTDCNVVKTPGRLEKSSSSRRTRRSPSCRNHPRQSRRWSRPDPPQTGSDPPKRRISSSFTESTSCQHDYEDKAHLCDDSSELGHCDETLVGKRSQAEARMEFSICEAVLIQTLAFHPWVASLQLLTNLNPTVSITSLLSVSPIFQTLIPNCCPIVNCNGPLQAHYPLSQFANSRGWMPCISS